MPLYIFAFLVIMAGTILEQRGNKYARKVFCASFVLLTVMLCFRYGQGTDFFSYASIYNAIKAEGIHVLWNANVHSEFGWKLLCLFFHLINIPYTGLIFIISVVEMLMLWRFINRYCKRCNLALLLCYHTLYLSYFFSALRQGLVTAIFLGLMLEWLLKKKYIHYCVACLICGSLHSSALMLLVLPFMQLNFFSSLKLQLILVLVAWSVGLILATGVLDAILVKILPQSVLNYFYTRSVSIAVLERLVTYGVVVVMYWQHIKHKERLPHYLEMMMKIVTVGMLLYGVFLWLPLVASRTAYTCKVVEIVLLTSIAVKDKRLRQLIVLYCFGLAAFMYFKNIGSYIVDGGYYEKVNIVNFPWVNVFNREAILDFRNTLIGYLP